MKLSIITIHCQTNFGSVFQSFALHKYLELSGYDSEIIDYRPDYIVNNNGKGIRAIIKRLFYSENLNMSRNKYDNFIAENNRLSKMVYHSFKELALNPPQTDLLIAGSDQLWNTNYLCGHDDSFKIMFADNIPKISYATSLNAKAMSDNELNELIGKISPFKAISVREKSSSALLSNAMNCEVAWVCDPVFLLDKSVYEQMCKTPETEDYILVYLADKSALLDDTVSYVKSKLNCKVVFVGGNFAKCECDQHIKGAGPTEMLSLLQHAKFVISGSFHATAFSHIFNKNFLTVIPSENSERINSLLSLSGFTTQFVQTKKDLDSVLLELDFTKSNNVLNNFADMSRKWLIQNIEDIAKA